MAVARLKKCNANTKPIRLVWEVAVPTRSQSLRFKKMLGQHEANPWGLRRCWANTKPILVVWEESGPTRSQSLWFEKMMGQHEADPYSLRRWWANTKPILVALCDVLGSHEAWRHIRRPTILCQPSVRSPTRVTSHAVIPLWFPSKHKPFTIGWSRGGLARRGSWPPFWKLNFLKMALNLLLNTQANTFGKSRALPRTPCLFADKTKKIIAFMTKSAEIVFV